MKKQITTILILLIMITAISAMEMNITAGESYSFQSEEFDYWEISGNSTNIEGLNITWVNGNTTIRFNKYFKADIFTIIIYNSKEEVITTIPSSSSGGSSGSCKYNKNFNWNCGDWGECIEGNQKRTCKEHNNCKTKYGQPKLIRICSEPTKPINETIVPEIIPEIPEILEIPSRSHLPSFITLVIITLILLYFSLRKEKTKKS